MEEKNNIESLIGHLNKYFETRWNLFVLNLSDKGSDLVSSVASYIIIGLLGIFFIFFISISIAYSIGNSVGSTAKGFLYVALFYLVLCILIYLFRNVFIKIPIVNKLLNVIYGDEKN